MARLFFTWAAAAAASEDRSSILTLTGDNFTSVVDADGAKLLVSFYAPWCGHCKRLEPQYEKAAGLVAEAAQKDATVVARLAMVDATAQTALADTHGVRNYPTLKWFHRGRGHEYTGGRTAGEIAEWVIRRGGEPLKKLADEEAVEAFVLSAPVAAVAYLPEAIEAFTPKVVVALTELAERIDVPIGRTHYAGPPTLMLARIFDEPNVTYDGSLSDAAAMERWVAAYSLPLVIEFNASTQNQIFAAQQSVLVALLHNAATPATTAVLGASFDAFRGAAAALRGEAIFVAMDVDAHSQLRDFFDVAAAAADGASGAALPAVVALDKDANRRYPLPPSSPLDAASIEEHVRNVLAGEAAPALRSQPVPPPGARDDDGFDMMVGATYEGEVLRQKHATVVMFHAPWCSYCKRLMPTWQALKLRYTPRIREPQEVAVARLDATANELRHPRLLDGFPGIYFFPPHATALEEATSHAQPDRRTDVEELFGWIEEQRRLHKAARPDLYPAREDPGAGAGAEAAAAHDEL